MTVLRIVSIDVGLKTFSLCCESFDLTKLCSSAPSKKYGDHGGATPEFEKFVIDVGACGELVHLEKTDLGEKKDIFTGVAFLNLYNWLDSLKEKNVFEGIDCVLVEAQMKTNHIATALMHHLHAWFLMTYRGEKIVKLYPSKNKTRVLGMPLKMVNRNQKLTKATKYQRKKWSVEMCKKVLEARNDEKNIKNIWVTNKAKKDDLCDTVMQCLSYVVNQVLSGSNNKSGSSSKTKTKSTKSKKTTKTKTTKTKKKSSAKKSSEEKTEVKKRGRKAKPKSPTKLEELNRMLGLN